MALPTRQLGKNGPKVTSMGVGLMGLSAFYGKPKPDPERHAFLDACYNEGERFWDSANAYLDSEDLLGAWFKNNPEKRKDIFLATKFALTGDAQGNRFLDSSPEHAKESIDKSLKRLGLPYVDLWYCHRVDGKTPVEKTIQAMAEVQAAGKCKYIGISECSARTLRRAHAVAPISAVQVEYSPFTLEIEKPQVELLKTARELGVAVVAYSPIGRGMLTGSIKKRSDIPEGDWRLDAPRFSESNFPKNMELTEKIVSMAKSKGVTPAQLTLAWLLAQGDDIFPIPGTTRVEGLKENLGALQVQLTSGEMQEIRKACENADVVGGRYPDAMMASLFGETPELAA